jgi:hypothetical protein
MRRLLTPIVIAVLAVIAVAALVDAFGGVASEPRTASATAPARSDGAPLPICERDQLALGLEVLDGTNAASLRHVKGEPCRGADLDLRVFVTTDGRRSEIPLGDAAVLDGDYSPGVERSVPFSICNAGSDFIAEATAGPYEASAQVQPGGGNCESAIRELSVDLGREPGTVEVEVAPLDPVTHTTSFVIDFPRRADLRVTAKAGSGALLRVLDTRRPARCGPVGPRESCVVDFGPLGEAARERWTIFVHKRSTGRAHVSFAVSFIPLDE